MTVLFKKKYKIKSARLPSWDYGKEAYYYVTICTKNMVCHFGKIRHGKMHLSRMGEIVSEEWLKTEKIRKNVELDEWIIMPNHIHVIIIITYQITESIRRVETPRRGVSTVAWKPNSLGSIINQFKSKCTKRIRKFYPSFSWQSRFYDHVIRNEKSLAEIRHYIHYNVQTWDKDEENPRISKTSEQVRG